MRNYLPIQVTPSFVDEDGIHFLDIDSQKNITGPIAEDIQAILSNCNGHNTPTQISVATGLDRSYVLEILEELESAQLICDSRKQYQHFHRVSSYPSEYSWELTQDEIAEYTASAREPVKAGESFSLPDCSIGNLERYLSRRKTCRQFDRTRYLSIEQICGACKAAYFLGDYRSVPSGGGLYPLEIYVAIEHCSDLNPGYYQYNPERNELVLYNRQIDQEQLKYCFNMEDLAYGAGIQIFIAADLERQVLKYGDRGYRLTLMEVGHAAQNIALFCTEHELGSCEFGGLLDGPIKAELQTSGSPLLAIGIGYVSDVNSQKGNMMRFVENHFKSYEIFAETFEDGDFFGATAKYNNDGYAGATARSYEYAIFKAGMEAYERDLSSQPIPSLVASQKDLEESGKICLMPDNLVPLSGKQKERYGFCELGAEQKIAWNKGIKTLRDGMTQEVYLPTDLVYYGFDAKEKLYNANSSGIAAHTDRVSAEKKALLELIERDAIMRSWFLHQAPPRIDETALPEHAKKRKAYWQSKNRNLVFLRLQSDYTAVIEVVISSIEYPCFVCGAAATYCENDGALDDAILKALDEAEYALFSYLTHPVDSCKSISQIKLPSDHGEYYHRPENAEKINWLWSSNDEIHLNNYQSAAMSFDELKRDLEIVTIDMSDKERDDSIYLVRVFSEKLVPISFGYGMMHYKHHMVANYRPQSLELPHYFA